MGWRQEMEQVKSILPRLFQQEQRALRDIDLILAYWPETVGPLLAEHSTPIRVEFQTLVVEVADRSWMELLAPMEGQIRSLLCKELPISPIRRIAMCLPANHKEPVRRAP